MKQIFYTINRDSSSHQYHHVYVHVYHSFKDDDSQYSAKPVLSLSWQGDIGSDHWYAFTAKSKTESAANGVSQFRLAATILSALAEAEVNTDDIGAVLGALSCPRLVEDRRVNKWLPLDEVKPSTWQRYMAWVDGSCCVACMAADETTAIKALIKEFSRNMDSGWGNYADKLTAWIKDGSPIKIDNYTKAPEVAELAELIKPMKAKEEIIPESIAA